MWDQLEDAAMETFSMSNHLSLCAVFIPPALGDWASLGGSWALDLGWKSSGFLCFGICNDSPLLEFTLFWLPTISFICCISS